MASSAHFEALPSEILTMIYWSFDSIFDLQSVMLASPRVWRHVGEDRQTTSILNELLRKDSVHAQVALVIRIAAHLHQQSPPLMRLLNHGGLRVFRPGLDEVIYMVHDDVYFLEALPEGMKPIVVRGLLATSSAIYDTTLHCLNRHLRWLHSLQLLTANESTRFELQEDKWIDFPTGPRSLIPDTGPLLWTEMQQMLKAFWMIYIARLFFSAHKQRAFEISEQWKDMEVDDIRPIDLFGFERQGRWIYHERNRPRDYLFRSMQLFLTAEEYLRNESSADDKPFGSELLPCKRTDGDTQPWEHVSETMEHFVRLFKEIRSIEHGDGFYPWRRLGFAIWDIERLRTAGLVHNPRPDRTIDRLRWLSVIREEDFHCVQNHRLVVSHEWKEVAEDDDFTFAYDTDESANSQLWDFGVCQESDWPKNSLAFEFGRQASDA